MMKNFFIILMFLFCFIIGGCTDIEKTDSALVENSSDNFVSGNRNTQNKISKAKRGKISVSNLFTDKDLEQVPKLDKAKYLTLSDNKDINITKTGLYVVQGVANDVTIYVDVNKEEKVQLVLDGVTITNKNLPCIYVKQADKVFITTTDTNNTLNVTEAFINEGDEKLNGAIYSKDDITLNGIGTLTINSPKNGIVSKDDLKITGGKYYITAAKKSLDANDSIRIFDGTFVLNAGTDGIHSENNKNDMLGFIYIGSGNFIIEVGDDGIHGTSIVQIDTGNIVIKGSEGLEGTYIQINGGNIEISATDDGINTSSKSKSSEVALELNGGYTKIRMGAGDSDGVDSNGNIYINDGVIDIVARTPADYIGTVIYNGGKIIVSGTEYDTLPNQKLMDKK